MSRILVDVPEVALSAIRQNPDAFAREMRLAAALFWFSRGRISQEVAAQIAGLNRREFILACGQARVNVFQTDAEDAGVGLDE